jgi:hypothetical protein
MKQFSLIAAIVALSFLAVPAFAQVTGGTILRSLADQLDRQSSGYRTELESDGLHLRDASTVNEVLAVHQIGGQQVTISGVVASLNKLSPDVRRQTLRRIALFNFSSPVGTLVVDAKTGEVTMEHNLNPRQVSIPAMAQVATMFGKTIRRQSNALLQ